MATCRVGRRRRSVTSCRPSASRGHGADPRHQPAASRRP
jgi:hypothetical protein